MSLIEKLEAVVKLCDAACAMTPSVEGVAAIARAETAAADFVIENHDAIRQAMIDAERLARIANQYLKVEPFDMPTPGGDDCDVGWKVSEFFRAAPYERVIATVYRDDLREAIDAARATGEGEGNG